MFILIENIYHEHGDYNGDLQLIKKTIRKEERG